MKQSHKSFVVAALAAVFFIWGLCPAHSADPAIPAGFDSVSWAKVDDSLKAAWQDAMKSGNTSQRLDCFVRVQAPFDRGDQSFLISNGFNLRAASGTIASGHLAASDLPQVAGLPFVVSVKLSTAN